MSVSVCVFQCFSTCDELSRVSPCFLPNVSWHMLGPLDSKKVIDGSEEKMFSINYLFCLQKLQIVISRFYSNIKQVPIV